VSEPKYRLLALEKLRDAKVDEATKKLAEAVKEREAASARKQNAERALDLHESEAARVRAMERASLEQGLARARALAIENAWEIGVKVTSDRLRAEIAKRKEEEARAVAHETEARAAVVAKKADAKVVHEDHDRFDADARKIEDQKEEEAAEEAWRPKH